ncbi:MAG: ribosome small subunit-dependent GTPase A [Clostridia bacterium]|nr:ribosome small subunit-dependent GTPase A [Clostridia bacterium]
MHNCGFIIKCVAGVYDVLMEDNSICSAYAAGKFRNQNVTPLAGDKVALKLSERENEKNLITEIFPRKNALVRPPVANVDTLLITLAVKKPNPDLKLADYLICYCRLLDIEPIVLINKSDYDLSAAQNLAQQFVLSGVRAFVTQGSSPDGAEKLKDVINEGITCFSGQSAVGKSTLTNLLLGKQMFQTGGLSKKTERGRHTTRHSEIVEFAKGKWLADTPGFSLLEMPELSPEQFKELYFEYSEYAGDCRFNGCNHIHEPDCAVKQAVEENKLSKQRYDRYVELFEEIKEKWRKRYD